MYCGELVTDLLTAITTCRLNSISSTPAARLVHIRMLHDGGGGAVGDGGG